jgi:hypothetical protein
VPEFPKSGAYDKAVAESGPTFWKCGPRGWALPTIKHQKDFIITYTYAKHKDIIKSGRNLMPM